MACSSCGNKKVVNSSNVKTVTIKKSDIEKSQVIKVVSNKSK